MTLLFADPMQATFGDWPLQAQAIGLANQPTAGLVAPIPTRVEIAAAPDGSSAYRCTIVPGDTVTYGGIRAHVAYDRETVHNAGGAAERWYRWEMFFPLDFSADDQINFMQIHDTPDGGEGTVKYPNFELMVQGEWVFAQVPLNCPTEAQTPRYPPGKRMPLVRGRWVTVAVHSNWSNAADGFVEVYFDNQLMVREWGRSVSYDDAIGPYWVLGMYDWNHTGLAHQYRVWYRNAKVYGSGHTAHEVLGAAPRIPQALSM